MIELSDEKCIELVFRFIGGFQPRNGLRKIETI
jgi:hypothetical protein